MNTFSKRKPKASIASHFVGVLQRDKNNRVKSVIVPGSEGKQYHVILRRFNRVIEIECRLSVGGDNHCVCKGNLKTICYHSIAAVEFALNEAGFSANWCKNENDANRIQKMLGGTIFNVKSRQSKKQSLIVVRRKENVH